MPLRYADEQLAKSRRKRLEFGAKPKFLAVSLNLGDRYFKPFDSSNRITVQHNRQINPNADSFAKKFNQAIDFYSDFIKLSSVAAVKEVERLSGNGNTAKPINIVKRQNLVTFFTVHAN